MSILILYNSSNKKFDHFRIYFHFYPSLVAACVLIMAADCVEGSGKLALETPSVIPCLSIVSAFLRSPLRESISLSCLYCFCMPNLKGPAIREPSIVSAVALELIVRTDKSRYSFVVLPNMSPAFFGDDLPPSDFLSVILDSPRSVGDFSSSATLSSSWA